MFHVLLFYKLTKVENPKNEERKMLRLCKALNIKGRVLISPDGINGTVSGTKEAVQIYRDYMDSHNIFSDIDFKEDVCESSPLPRLRIISRDEIVTTDARRDFDLQDKAQYINRDDFHQWLKNKEDIVILDLRNDYEWEVGRFRNSVKPPMKYFRDLKNCLEFYDMYKGKKVVTFCTGGVRCEFATPQLVKTGFKKEDIFQLEGGIIKYIEKYGDEGYFEGKCFVFDDRLVVSADTTANAVVVGRCHNCQAPTDEFYNCKNATCNKLMLACHDCITQYDNTCSSYCQEVIKDPSKVRPDRIKILHRNK